MHLKTLTGHVMNALASAILCAVRCWVPTTALPHHKVSLTAVPMMEGIQVILGRDWLDTVNPLVDWRTNSLVLRNGDKLEVVQGIKTSTGQSCQIVDHGLTGLQHVFHSLENSAAKPTEKWSSQYAQLGSLSFWEPTPSVKKWA